MRKGIVDIWMMIGILMMLIIFALLLFFQQTGQNSITPQLDETRIAPLGIVLWKGLTRGIQK